MSLLLSEIESRMRDCAARLAVSDGQRSLSYAEIDGLSNQIGREILERIGVTAARVALLVPRESMASVAILAVLRSGHAYVPLDTLWPVARMREIVRDAGVACLLCPCSMGALAEQLIEARHILFFEDCTSARGAPLAIARSDDQLTYILYTSGTTGAPKGVYQCDANVAHHSRTYARSVSLGPSDRLTLLPSYAFDAAVMDIFGALQSGASIHLYDPRERGITDLLPWVARSELSIWHSTPTLLRAAAEAYGGAPLRSLRYVVLGGEAAHYRDVKLVGRRMGQHCVVVNGYGPTESTLAAQFFIEARERSDEGPLPIGSAVAETALHVRDEQLVIQSRYLACGYWNDPELTAQRFFPAGDGTRCYRTGDRAKRLPDGQLLFLGRDDDQVKIRGFRVELGEVESALRALPAVRGATVLIREDCGVAELAAYVVVRPPRALTSREIAARLRETLPEYMLPSSITLIESIPLTANGKVDRRALPAPARDSGNAESAEFVSDLERRIAAAWQHLLGRAVDVRDDLIAAGGNSLLLMQLAGQIHRLLGHELPLRLFFEGPTIRKIAAAADRIARQHGIQERQGDAASGHIPLAFGQQYLWEYYLLDPEGAERNNLNVGLRIRGPLDVERLERALRYVVALHEGLRTHLARVDARPVQVVGEVPEVLLSRSCRPDLLADAARLQSHCLQQAAAPFDLFSGPLMRAELYEASEDDHFLLLVVHHFIFDAWSKSVMLHDWGKAYGASLSARDAVPQKVTQFRTLGFAHAQCTRERAPATFEYWERALRDLPPRLEMPADKARPARFTHVGGVVPFELTKEVSGNLGAQSRRLGVTNYVLLLTALMRLLHEEGGNDDLFVRSYGSSRSSAGSDEAIGYYMQQIVVRVRSLGGRDWADLVARVHDSTLDALSNMNVPFAHLVASAGPRPDAGYASRFQLVFNYIDFPRRWLRLDGLDVHPVHIDEPLVAKYDVSVVAEPHGEVIRGRFMYYADLFSVERASYLARRYCELLETIGKQGEGHEQDRTHRRARGSGQPR